MKELTERATGTRVGWGVEVGVVEGACSFSSPDISGYFPQLSTLLCGCQAWWGWGWGLGGRHPRGSLPISV